METDFLFYNALYREGTCFFKFLPILGIGKATALRFAQKGAKVIATDINIEALKSYEGIANISTKVLDVTDKEAINQLAKDIDKIDVLFNCAG